MRIGAYQFAVSNSIDHNYEVIKKAIIRAAEEGVKLLAFPECALTGYPPRDIESSSVVDFQKLDKVYDQLQDLINEKEIYVIIGTILREDDEYYNSAIILKPNQDNQFYHKRALWGWDRDNFLQEVKTGFLKLMVAKLGFEYALKSDFRSFLENYSMYRFEHYSVL